MEHLLKGLLERQAQARRSVRNVPMLGSNLALTDIRYHSAWAGKACQRRSRIETWTKMRPRDDSASVRHTKSKRKLSFLPSAPSSRLLYDAAIVDSLARNASIRPAVCRRLSRSTLGEVARTEQPASSGGGLYLCSIQLSISQHEI